MAFDEQLRIRIESLLRKREADFAEKRMFGGVAFMINDKMSIGINGDEIMLRVMPERFDETLAMPNVREMDFTGRPMRGFVFVEPAGTDTDDALDRWVSLAIEFGEKGVVKSKPKKR